jgi:AbrB family looped-hinge helix DNA binding protein
MGKLATLTSKSQITIPAEIRRRLGIGPGDKVVLEIEGDRAVLRPLHGSFTDYMQGLGREVWEEAGPASDYLERERDEWPRD